MTKFQIVSPNGKNVCIIEAQTVKYFQMNCNDIYSHVIFNDDAISFELPADWVVIPLDIIGPEEENGEEEERIKEIKKEYETRIIDGGKIKIGDIVQNNGMYLGYVTGVVDGSVHVNTLDGMLTIRTEGLKKVEHVQVIDRYVTLVN